jgi:hypothetical protein
MFKSQSAIFGLMILLLTLVISGCVTAAAAPEPAWEAATTTESSSLQLTLSGPHTSLSWDVRDPSQQKFEMPVLFLHRDEAVAEAVERTLTITLTGLPIATEIQLEIVSHHADVTTGAPFQTTKSYLNVDRPCTAIDPCSIQLTLDGSMPSDLFYLRVKGPAGETLWQDPNGDRPSFAALESWNVRLGAYDVRVYYATLFPFARGQNDLANRLTPQQVPAFIEQQFLPIIAETWNTQYVAWGFGNAVHPQWDADNIVEVIITNPPFALFDGTGTYARFTGDDGQPYPERRIWWYASNNSFQAYDTLANAYKAVFAHEFFHLMQWNVLLFTGRPANMWLSVIEAQGRFAPAIQYPELELSREHLVAENSAYASAANRFLTQHLNTSYDVLEADQSNKYDAALYWRFLFEHYQDMGIVRAALEEMTQYYGPDIVRGMKSAMDAAFARVDGPFHSFEESLVAFARANYALRLEYGRYVTQDAAGSGAFLYDPHGVYAPPTLEAQLGYSGSPLSYSGAVGSSYGMDFVEIELDPALQGQSLTVRLQGQDTAAHFAVQVWQLGPGYGAPRAITPEPEVISQAADAGYAYVIPAVNTMASNGLALIITRLDPDEGTGSDGAYTVKVTPTG